MPVIPSFERERSISTGQGEVSGAGRAETASNVALATFGESLAGLGHKALELNRIQQERLDQARELSEISRVKVELEKDAYETQEYFNKTNTNYKDFHIEYENMVEQRMQKYRDIVTNQETWDKLQPLIYQNTYSLGLKVKNLQSAKMIDDIKAQTLTTVTDLAELYIKTGDIKFAAEITNTVNRTIASGAMPGVAGIELIKKTLTSADQTRAERLIQENPEDAYNLIPNKQLFPFLTEDQVVSLQKASRNYAFTEFHRRNSLENKQQEATLLRAYQLLDLVEAGKMKPNEFRTQIDKWMEIDKETGMRAMTPSTGHSIKKELERMLVEKTDRYGDVISFAKYLGKIKDGVFTEEDRDKLITDRSLSTAEKKNLLALWYNETRRDEKKDEKMTKEQFKLVDNTIKGIIDAMFPKKDSTKNLNLALNAYIYLGRQNYSDPEAYREWATKVIDWAKTQDDKWFVGPKGIAEKLKKDMQGGSLTPQQTTTPSGKIQRPVIRIKDPKTGKLIDCTLDEKGNPVRIVE